MQFDFSTASKIIFGSGKLSLAKDLVSDLGDHILVISGAPPSIKDRLTSLLESAATELMTLRTETEPSTETIGDILTKARAFSPHVIIGIGGGSAIDVAKVISVLLTNQGELSDYLEVVGKGQKLSSPAVPVIAIPTTAGTGSEVTRNAVISSLEYHVKVSLRSSYMLPRIALIDPELTISLPPLITATTGLDALTQLIEPFTSNSSNPFTDALCTEGIQRVGRSLPCAFDQGTDISAREDISLAALFSGISLANAKLGAVHGFAGVLGGETGAHHGAICASLLANVMEVNFNALSERAPDHPVLERYAVIGRLLTGNSAVSAHEGFDWVRSFCIHAKIQSLSSLGLKEHQFSETISMAQKASSMKGNPITLTENELLHILKMSF